MIHKPSLLLVISCCSLTGQGCLSLMYSKSDSSLQLIGTASMPYSSAPGSGAQSSASQFLTTAADARFQHTGLERSQRLATDIDWLQREHSLAPPEVAASGPGSAYSECASCSA